MPSVIGVDPSNGAYLADAAIVLLVLVGIYLATRKPGVDLDVPQPDEPMQDQTSSAPRSPFTGGRTLAELSPVMIHTRGDLRGLGFCKSCGDGVAELPLFRTSTDVFNRELPELEHALESAAHLFEWSQRHHDRDDDPRGSVVGMLHYCPTCFTATLHSIPVQKGWLIERVRTDEAEESTDISPLVAKELVEMVGRTT